MTLPTGVGAVVAVVVLVIAILGVLGIVPASPQVVFGLLGATAVSRLC
jgi:flagellar biosynthesis component FlhA